MAIFLLRPWHPRLQWFWRLSLSRLAADFSLDQDSLWVSMQSSSLSTISGEIFFKSDHALAQNIGLQYAVFRLSDEEGLHI
ncbi:MAG: hypothetical protein EHM14_06645 [Methanothrix sp.]|nr:MAG: hypothetical protein EHM14_06645 [Methanothrix sp.]